MNRQCKCGGRMVPTYTGVNIKNQPVQYFRCNGECKQTNVQRLRTPKGGLTVSLRYYYTHNRTPMPNVSTVLEFNLNEAKRLKQAL